MKQTLFLFAAIVSASLSGCSLPVTPVTPSSGTVYMWIGASADTKIDADYPDMNFYKAGDLTFARNHLAGASAWYAKSFVKFQLPVLPAGTKIDEAYFEMYHSGTTEDGTTDNTEFLVSPVGRQWRADSITWNNSPDRGTPSVAVNPIHAKLHSNDWSGTGDITNLIKSWFDDSTRNTGFRIEIGDHQNFYKSFYSNNSYLGAKNSDGRNLNSMGKAPRLLVKIELPPGTSTSDILFSGIIPDNDITAIAFRQAQYMSGTPDFPVNWSVKKGQ